jgi:hypothetical protein
MTELEFVDLVSCLMRVVWAAAAGKLYLASLGIQVSFLKVFEEHLLAKYRYLSCTAVSSNTEKIPYWNKKAFLIIQ